MVVPVGPQGTSVSAARLQHEEPTLVESQIWSCAAMSVATVGSIAGRHAPPSGAGRHTSLITALGFVALQPPPPAPPPPPEPPLALELELPVDPVLAALAVLPLPELV